MELLGCCRGIAAADNRITGSFRTSLRHRSCTVGERFNFEYAHWAVPYDELRFFDHFGIALSCSRTDIDAFPVGRNAVDVNDPRVRIRAEIVGYYDVDRKHKVDAFFLGFIQE